MELGKAGGKGKVDSGNHGEGGGGRDGGGRGGAMMQLK